MIATVPRKTAYVLALIVALAFLPYVSALGMGFVYDDRPQIENNPNLRLWPGYARVFTSDVWSLTDVESDARYYRPLMWVAYNAVYSMAGPAPWAFHLLNLLLHAAVTAVVFVLTLELWKDLRVSTIAGVLFALHPVHIEPVVWIAAVPDLAYTLFFLLAVYFYVADYKPAMHATIAYVMCYVAGLLWKETAIMFLPCVVLYDGLVLRQFRARRYALLGAVTLAYLSVRAFIFDGLVPGVVHEGLSLSTQVLTAISHLGIYIEKLLVPVNLSFFYGLHTTSSVDLRIVAVVLILAVGLWKLRGKLAWSLLWIPLILLPALSISRVVVPLAERNLYLASVGFVWIAAAVLAQLELRKTAVLTAALCAGYIAVAWYRVPVWRDELLLFAQALQLEPDNPSIRLRLSTELIRHGRPDDAMAQLDEILKRSPSDIKTLTSKAGLQVFKKDWQGVEETCAKTLQLEASTAVCHLDMGIAALNLGRRDDAWQRLERAYEINPRMWQALLQQGAMAFDAGDLPLAIRKLEGATALSPSAEAFTMLGAAYGRAGDPQKAAGAFTQALRINPGFAPARQALGQVSAQ